MLIQCASGPYLPLLSKTSRWHARYCKHWGIAYQAVFGAVQQGRHPNWDRFPLILNALRLPFDYIIYLDADAIICNPNVDIQESANNVVHLGLVPHGTPWSDWSFHYNLGAIFARNRAIVTELFQQVWDYGPQANKPEWPTQEPFHHCINLRRFAPDRLEARWNSTVSENPVPNPVIQAFHGRGVACLPELTEIADRLKLELLDRLYK